MLSSFQQDETNITHIVMIRLYIFLLLLFIIVSAYPALTFLELLILIQFLFCWSNSLSNFF